MSRTAYSRNDRHHKIHFGILSMLFLGLITLFTASPAFSGSTAPLKQMAKIMLNLNHYPDGAGKTHLNKIIGAATSSAHEKTLARAMLNLEHRVNSADAGKLQSLLSSGSANAHEKTLANIILSLSHSPSSEDKKHLQALLH
jgi:hypothetical protein